MGNHKPVGTKRKKKGRPSLLDLQKRSLRQEQQQQRNPNPSPNPYLRFPGAAPGRRIIRRNPNSAASPSPGDDDEEDDEDSGSRREKKLKLVVNLPTLSADSPSGIQDRKLGNGDRDKAERDNRSKATDLLRELGPTTPLPDEKLLVFILDRLQKKDKYSVFAEPVDPEELPDYHEIIDHPMDFRTVRGKLSNGAYANLEQFEKDVFLISSNAMTYNPPDTIYYRQARSIQELAKKNFENLRQESDDNEPEPKVAARRGRPPTKNMGRTAASDFSSDAAPCYNNSTLDLSRKQSAPDKAGEKFNSMAREHKAERSEEYSGSAPKGTPAKFGRRINIIDESRRNTYIQPQQPSDCAHQPPLLTFFHGEEKQQVIPVGLHMEHAYARSLARFAANLGPVGWAIAAKKIERSLPRGTKFGRGWVGDSEAPQQSHTPSISSSIAPCTTTSSADKLSRIPEPPSNGPASFRFPDPVECAEPSTNHEYRGANGFAPAFGFNLASQFGKLARPRSEPSRPEAAPMTHGRALDLVSRGNGGFDPQRTKLVNSSLLRSGADSMMTWRGQKPESAPPDLNVRFPSPGSPASGVSG